MTAQALRIKFAAILALFLVTCDFPTDKEEQAYVAIFTVDGITKSFTTEQGFWLDDDEEGIWYCEWQLDEDSHGYHELEDDYVQYTRNVLECSFPCGVESGTTYTQADLDPVQGFNVLYYDESEVCFSVDTCCTFSLTILEWDEEVVAEFAGRLVHGRDTVMVEDGQFEASVRQRPCPSY